MRLLARKNIGDSKLPNRYWVSESNNYYLRTKEKDGSIYLKPIEEENPNFKHEGKTYPKIFKTYKEALTFLDTLSGDNRIIEDRLSGQVFEAMKIICPCCGKEEWESFSDIKYTKERMEKLGIKFE
jgi:hypothetical protein